MTDTSVVEAPAPAPGAAAWASHSSSVMFLLYMVIGFSVTLGVILLVLGTYYCGRCLLWRRARRRPAPSAQASAGSTTLEPKEVFLVVQPGGSATMAYRDGDEKRCQVPRGKALIPVKSVVISLAADCSSGALIAARHPSGSAGSSGAPRATPARWLTPEYGGAAGICRIVPEVLPDKPPSTGGCVSREFGKVAGTSAAAWEASGAAAALGAAPAAAAEPASLRARYGQPASPSDGPQQPAAPGPRPLPLPDQGRPASAGAAGAGERPPASPDGKAPLGCCARTQLPLRPGSAGVREPPDSPGSPESAAPAAAAAARRGGARQALWPDAPQRPSDAPGAGSPLRPSLQQPAQTHLLAAAMQEWPWAGEHTGAAM